MSSEHLGQSDDPTAYHAEVMLDHLDDQAYEDYEERLNAIADLERAANTDHVTGLPNRRVFESTASSLMDSGTPFEVAIVDLDRFKDINDTYGHAAGDLALWEVANLIEPREGQLFARIGGDEFAIITDLTKLPDRRKGPDPNYEGPERRFKDEDQRSETTVPERMLERLPAVNARLQRRHPGMEIQFSVGAALHRPGEPLEATMIRADQNMYGAKRSGSQSKQQ